MMTVIQRVNHAHVAVSQKIVGEIQQGLLVLCGFETTDTTKNLEKMLDKLLRYRIFSDEHGKMNKSLQDIAGGLLLVPQFTLIADTQKGLRPSFSQGAPPKQGQELFEKLKEMALTAYNPVNFGQFGADMQVHLCNDGPVTFVMLF